MASFSNFHDTQYEDPASRSPRAYRAQQPALNRMGSRQMDGGYGSMHTNILSNNSAYGSNNAATMRYNNGPFIPQLQNGVQSTAMSNGHFPYDTSAAQTWNANANGLPHFANNVNGFGGDPARSVRASRGRPGIANLWDQDDYSHQQAPQQTGRQVSMAMRPPPLDDDDELIPTAIVIKNIPFAVKKEQLVALMTNMNLPLPYAFNYHFDNGVFRGLAFANFTSPVETEQVIQALNHLELSGRKLRVEYKKMLPQAERERIEREKRERRGQLEEQHRPLPGTQLRSQISLSALSQARNTPSPSLHRAPTRPAGLPEIDMNDPVTLEYYTKLMIFKNSSEPETLIFPSDTSPENRKIIHTLAHHMSLQHTSHGDGDRRQVHVQRPVAGTNISPPNPMSSMRHGLSRTSTAEYDHGRGYDGPEYGTLRGQASVGLLGVSDSHAFGRSDAGNLRNAKSFHDLRSWSPSPAHSVASFPVELQRNGARLQALNDTASANTPVLTPAASTPALNTARDEPFLISTFGNLGLGNGAATQTSPRRQRSNFFNQGQAAWDEQQSYNTGPIGSKRTISVGTDNLPPIRQSRGPTTSGLGGFIKRGRGSDEMHRPSAITE